MKIKNKILISFLIIAVLMGLSTLYSITVVEDSDYKKQILQEIKSDIKQQEIDILSYISIDLKSIEKIHESHDHIQIHIRELIESSDASDDKVFFEIQELDKNLMKKQLSDSDTDSILNLVIERDSTLEEFLKKNNAHIVRISEYKNYWGDSNVNELLDNILINIDIERKFVLDFNPYNDDFNQIREEFRKTNDIVVKDLVFLLVKELDLYINAINVDNLNLQQVKNSLISQKEIASKITATTFPIIDDQQANLVFLESASIVYFSEAVDKTVLFGKSCEKNVKAMEDSGFVIRERFNVNKVGENKNSIQVLISVIKCQQGLRVNAEDYMESQILIKNNLDNSIFPLNQKILELIDQMLLKEDENFSGPALIAILLITGVLIFTIILGIFVSNSISKPINRLRESTHAIAKGDLEMKTIVSGTGEIAQLARDIDHMVDELNKKQESLVKSEKLSSIGNLASRLAHDIRNPLSVLSMSLENLQMVVGESKEVKNSFLRMGKAIDRITHQIESVLDFIRAQPSKFGDYSAIQIIESAITMVKIPDTVKISMPSKDVIINCDEKQCEVVFYNLIQNSVQAMKENSGEITIRIIEQDSKVLIEFEDDGTGIPEKNLEKIFEPLFSTKQTGTGLGLASCKNLVESFGAKITVRTTPTVFTIDFPKKKNL